MANLRENDHFALRQILDDAPRRKALENFCEDQAAYYAETYLELPRPKTQDELVEFQNKSAELVGQRKAWKSLVAELEKLLEP
jgi:hypothetical protein